METTLVTYDSIIFESPESTATLFKIDEVEIWIPDSREKFFGAVHALLSLLSPEINRDEETKKELKIAIIHSKQEK